MANPLARVVMNNIAQKSGMVEKKSSNRSSSSNMNNGTSNLDRRETQLLSSLMNNKSGATTMGSSSSKSSSYSKSSYGRTTNISNANANTMKTLDSLVSKANSSGHTSSSQQKNDNCGIDKSRPDLRSLCSLDNISIGKTNVEKNDRDVMKKLDLSQLVDGKIKTNKREEKTSYNKQTSGMTTLGDLANEKTKNKQQEPNNDKTSTMTTGNSYVKSNVINNLEAYIPKVTLESIGKKGSLF